MSISSLLREPCTLLRATAGTPDVFNDMQPGAPVEEETVCHFETIPPQQLHGAESDDFAYPSTNITVFLPGTLAQPSSNDAIRVKGEVWEFVEIPEAIVHPRTRVTHHYEALARRAG